MNTAAFTTVAMNDVNTVGAPSYTSGVQKCSGAADTLNAMEKSNSSIPAIINGDPGIFSMSNFCNRKSALTPRNERDTHEHQTC